jgi:hypothetical protein
MYPLILYAPDGNTQGIKVEEDKPAMIEVFTESQAHFPLSTLISCSIAAASTQSATEVVSLETGTGPLADFSPSSKLFRPGGICSATILELSMILLVI